MRGLLWRSARYLAEAADKAPVSMASRSGAIFPGNAWINESGAEKPLGRVLVRGRVTSAATGRPIGGLYAAADRENSMGEEGGESYTSASTRAAVLDSGPPDTVSMKKPKIRSKSKSASTKSGRAWTPA